MKVVPILAGCVLSVLCFAPLRGIFAADVDKAQKKPGADVKKARGALNYQIMLLSSKGERSRDIIQTLGLEFDFGVLQELPSTRLHDLLRIIEQNMAQKVSPGFRFYVDTSAFGTTKDNGSAILEAEVSFMNAPRRMSLRSAIEYALGQLPEKNATFIVRRGFLEITTKDRLEPKVLFSQLVTIGQESGKEAKLAEIFEDLSDQTGVAIVVDPKAAEKTKRSVALNLGHNVSLDTAIDLLMRMSGLKAVKVGRAIYVTLPDEKRAFWKRDGKPDWKRDEKPER